MPWKLSAYLKLHLWSSWGDLSGWFWRLLLIVSQQCTLVATCLSVYQAQGGIPANSPGERLLTAACLVPRRPFLAYPGQAETSEQRYRAGGERPLEGQQDDRTGCKTCFLTRSWRCWTSWAFKEDAEGSSCNLLRSKIVWRGVEGILQLKKILGFSLLVEELALPFCVS